MFYLKRVIVTPAVYQLLAQMSQPFCFAKQNQIFGQAFLLVKKGCLEPSLKYRHWAGVTDYTHPYGLAVSQVFVKQSGSLCNCTLLPQLAQQQQGPLIPKARGQFAEFPQLGLTLHTLGFTPRGTCAGSGYGYPRFFSAPFLRAPDISQIPKGYSSHL